MHLHQRRPKPHTSSPTPNADFALGKCYLARQTDLIFGRHRRAPIEWRPVVSWAAQDDIAYVLPATTQPNTHFFHLDHQHCHLKHTPNAYQDSYLCPQIEALPRNALIEIGILDHPTRLDIAQWKRRRESAQ